MYCRAANAKDAESVARIFSISLRALDFLPILHSEQEDETFIRGILQSCTVLVFEDEGKILGFIATEGNEIRVLHVLPTHKKRHRQYAS
jgi:hypothetical protein